MPIMKSPVIDIPAEMAIAIQHHQAGRLHQAENICRRVLSVEPDNAEACHCIGVIAHQVGKSDAAVALINKALSVKPDYLLAHNSLGLVLTEQRKFDTAIDHFQKALSLKADFPEAMYNLGRVLYLQGRFDDAIAQYRKLISLCPGNANAHYNLGVVFKELGRMEKAVVCFRKALSIDSNLAVAWINLSEIVKFREYDADVRAMEKLSANDNLPDEQRIALLFALGKACDDIGKHEQSFAYIVEGNQLKRASYSYSSQRDQVLFARIKAAFSKDFFSCHPQSGCRDKTPIFIVGMPRSGTSLVEQILASHPQVFGAGELQDISRIVQADHWAKMTEDEFGAYMSGLSDSRLEKLGAEYITCLGKYSPDKKYIIDKMPYNFLFIGLIRAILPNARVIHCTRDPMDTCYSIFKHIFGESGGHKYGYDLGELGSYYRLYRDLMNHWQDVLPGFVYCLSYEEMVSDQLEQTRKLLDFCQLPWDENCMSFHKTERRVATLSGMQVRKPIYKDSVQLWKRYEMQLEPLRQEILG